MNRILLLLLLCVPALIASAGMAIAPGTAAHTHTDANSGGGTLTVSGTLSSTKACATGYVRTAPNYCKAVGISNYQLWTDGTACTGRTFTQTLPADAKAADIRLLMEARANNAVNVRTNSVSFWADLSCTSWAETVEFGAYEHVAVVAGTIIGRAALMARVPLTLTNNITTTQQNAGGNGNAEVTGVIVVGYVD